MHYPDLGNNAYSIIGDYIRAVGWLSSEHPFPTGDSSAALIARVKQFAHLGGGQREIGWPSEFGRHTCELCQTYRTAGEIAVPDANLLYMAPNMLHHYMEAHRYAPPTAFAAALMASPLPGTEEYRTAVAGFRDRYWQDQRKAEQEAEERKIEIAADWVVRHGGDEEALQRWKRMFWHTPSFGAKHCGSEQATMEYIDRLETEFFDRVRARMRR